MSEADVSVLEDYGIPPVYTRHLVEDRGIETLWKTQIDALERGLLKNGNFLMVSEPGTGKTLAAEFAIIERAVHEETSVFLVPYRALADEKTDSFRANIGEELDLRIESSLGGGRHDPDDLFAHDILVMTYEKFDYHLRNHGTYIRDIGAVVIDEFHTLGKSVRGPNLEIVATRLKTDFPDTRIVGLSATAPNVDEIAEWIGARYSDSGTWRKCPLYEGVYVESNHEVIVETADGQRRDGIDRWYDNQLPGNYESSIDPIIQYLGENEKRQCLVFAPTRDKAETLAKSLKTYQIDRNRSTPIQIDGVKTTLLQKDLEESIDVSSATTDELIKSVNHGIGFHHAGLPDVVKRSIVAGVEDEILRVVVSTTGLGAGINLPIERVFITKPRIGSDLDEYGRDMYVGEYKNLAGRAGRPQFGVDPGEAILYAPNELRRSSLRSEYIDGMIEPVESEIDINDPKLVINLLRDCSSAEALAEYLGNSFFGFKENIEDLDINSLLEEMLKDLEKYGMVTKVDTDNIELTDLGLATSKKHIHPETVYRASEYLRSKDEDKFENLDFLILLSSGPLLARNRVYSWQSFDLDKVRKHVPISDSIEDDDLGNAIATAIVVNAWMEGNNLEDVFEEHQIAQSRTSADVTERAAPVLARGIKIIGEIIREGDEDLAAKYGDILDILELQVRHGLDKELVPFSAHGITSDRQTIEYLRDDLGIEHPKDIVSDDVTILFGAIDHRTAYKFARKAINEFYDSRMRERKHTLLDAREVGPGISEIRDLLNATEGEFQRHCEELLDRLDGCIYNAHDERVRKKIAEGTLHILNEERSDFYLVDSVPLSIAVECKSKRDLLDGEIDADEAIAVVQKADPDDEPFLLTIGNPGFSDDAIDAAERQGVLLLSAAAFATLVIYSMDNDYTPDQYTEIFTQEGLLTRPEILRILGEW